MDENPYESPAMPATLQSESPSPRRVRPWWVKLGLWGLPHRSWAWACFWLSVLLGLAGLGLLFWDPRLIVGGTFFLAAYWYWAAIRWVDRYDRW